MLWYFVPWRIFWFWSRSVFWGRTNLGKSVMAEGELPLYIGYRDSGLWRALLLEVDLEGFDPLMENVVITKYWANAVHGCLSLKLKHLWSSTTPLQSYLSMRSTLEACFRDNKVIHLLQKTSRMAIDWSSERVPLCFICLKLAKILYLNQHLELSLERGLCRPDSDQTIWWFWDPVTTRTIGRWEPIDPVERSCLQHIGMLRAAKAFEHGTVNQ